ncbi:lantibiotic dehydratase [Bacillus mycoides]|uniref:Thiopeptide-type bacteriocin biosynthesis domain-containing protein n=1 Tax=Bacillus mycoides TaxID=1405 RepID=A0A4U2ZXD7_BACMY|nr:lantibiotic dehydratase [Bacillus mycoides]TKI79030.1 thiopeptide-type bacteriocin biosynthesis domain-containing protein [Bacillus mycoides]
MKHQLLNTYMYRKPILTLKEYQELFDSKISTLEYENKIKEIFSDDKLKLAIYISSPTMYEALNRLDSLDAKKKRNFLHGITKFLIRMSTRPTPFGLFAGMGIESINNNGKGSFNIDSYFRLDFSTIYKIVEVLENQDEILKKTNIRFNNLLYKHGNRLKLPYQSNVHNKDNIDEHMKIMTVKNSPVLDYIRKITRNDINFEQLVDKINKEFNTEDTTSKGYLKKLMDNDILFSDLRPALSSNDPFKYLITILEEKNINHELLDNLKQINFSLDKFNLTKEEISVKELSDFKSLLKTFKLCGEKDIRVDAKLTNSSELALGDEDITNLEELSRIMSYLGCINPLQVLNSYRDSFIEKYGPYQEVPILELLDEDLGLGKPNDYVTNGNSQPQISENLRAVRNLIQKWQTEALINNENIILDEDKIKEIKKHISRNDIEKENIDLELYFNYFQCKGANKFYLVPNTGSTQIGNTYGRFKYMFNKNEINQLKDFNEFIEDQDSNIKFADLRINPDNSSLANIMNSPSVYKSEINLCTNPSESCSNNIDIENLVVGINNNKFYIRDSSSNNIIIPKISNMFNYENANLIYRFLADVGALYSGIWGNIHHHFYDSHVYPKIVYKNIVVSPKRWIFHHTFTQKMSEEEFISVFLDWCTRNNITNYIYLAEYDNKLLLNIKNKLHLSIIFQEFSKLKMNDRLSLFECEEDIFVSSNKRFEECVFSFRQTDRKKITFTNSLNRNYQYINDMNRVKLLGSDWISLRVNYVDSRVEEFLSCGYKEFYKHNKDINKIEKGFFVRYANPTPHLRIRFKLSKNEKYNTFLGNITEWLTNEREKGLVNDFHFVSYNPEIERYGDFLIDKAEDIFSIDSLIVADSFEGDVPLSRELFCCLNIMSILKGFNLNFASQLEILNMAIDPKIYKEAYRENKANLDPIITNIYDYIEIPMSEKLIIPTTFNDRDNVIRKYAELIDANEDVLTNVKSDIIASILHMHCNRLNGINRDLENKILGMCYHTIKKYMNLIKYKYNVLV